MSHGSLSTLYNELERMRRIWGWLYRETCFFYTKRACWQRTCMRESRKTFHWSLTNLESLLRNLCAIYTRILSNTIVVIMFGNYLSWIPSSNKYWPFMAAIQVGELNTGPQSMDFNTPMDYPRMDYGHWSLVIRVRRFSDSISGHHTRKTGLKLDWLSFPTLITKCQQQSPLWLGVVHYG